MRHFDDVRYKLLAFVVMNDHVHAILEPTNNSTLSAIMHSWKSFTASRLQREQGRRGPVWQHGYYDHIVRDDEGLSNRIDYILGNPQKRWPDVEDYPWVWNSFD